MGNHDPYSDPSGGDYREGRQAAEAFFRSLLGLGESRSGRDNALVLLRREGRSTLHRFDVGVPARLR